MSLGHGNSSVRNSLVLHLDAANLKSYPGSGNTWFDLSGNNNHGTIFNNLIISNGVASFNGTDTYVSVADSPLLSFIGNSFTFEYIVKFNSLSAPHGILGKRGQWEYSIWSSDLTRIQHYCWPLSGAGPVFTNVHLLTISAQQWYHCVFTADGTTSRLYVNSTLYGNVGTKGTYTMGDGINPLIIGAGGDAQGLKYLNGELPSIKIYNRAFSSEEVQQNFNALRGRYGI